MAELLTALDQVLATPEAQALSLDSDTDRARLLALFAKELERMQAVRPSTKTKE